MRKPPQWSEFQRYPITAGTIVLATVVSLAHWTGRDISPFYENALIQKGQLWRLITSILPHVNVVHWAFNCYWLWIFGTLLEEAFGHFRFLGILLLCAIGSGAAEYAILEGGVGLSGVGYGLFGMLWVLRRRDPRFAKAMDTGTITTFVVWFFICIITTYAGVMRVANIAHGVGALIGMALGAGAGYPRYRPLTLTTLLLFLVSVVAAAVGGRPYVNLAPNRGKEEARLGYETLLANQNEQARRWLELSVRLRPREAGSWHNLGLAYQRLGRHADAQRAFETERELEPSDGSNKRD